MGTVIFKMADRPLFIRLSMPSGLEDALEGLAREVLRAQPKDMLEFSAQYFEGLLRTRNKDLDLSADDLYGLLAHNGYQANYPDEPDDDVKPTDFDEFNQSKKVDIDLDMDMKSEESSKIGETNHKVDEDIDIDLDDPDTEAAAIKIQASIRGRQARKQVREIKETKEEIEETVEEFDIDLTDPETSLAATKIQA